MQILEIKQKLEEIIEELPESELKIIVEFANYLKNRKEAEEILKMQQTSMAFEDWVSAENDIYDEVFKDEIK